MNKLLFHLVGGSISCTETATTHPKKTTLAPPRNFIS